jgi:type IV secretion system protein VirB10
MAEEKENKQLKTPDINEPEVNNELSQVASNPKNSIAIAVVLVLVFIAIFYNMFASNFKQPEVTPATPKPQDSQIVKPNTDMDIPAVPSLPEPKLVEPTAPPLLPATPIPPVVEPAAPTPPLPTTPVPNLPTNIPSDGSLTGPSDEDKRRMEAKRKSPIIVKDSGSAPKPQNPTVAKIQSLEYTLGRGKIIDAVLESAVNTDFGGEIRAIISRDIFSEGGRVILIPKGSRIFGTYSTDINGAYGRVQISWDRIDLASGFRLSLNALAIDNLGRKGVQGRVDNKYTEKMANAALISAFNILAAQGIDKIIKPVESNQASTQAQATATNINTAVNALPSTATYADICTAIRNAFTDQTSTAFTQADDQCKALITSSATAADKSQTARNIASAAATSVVSLATTSTTQTKAQAAAEDAYKSITDTVKGILEQQDFQPTITIDQGRPIKIYVTKDYEFPKEAIFKSRMIK